MSFLDMVRRAKEFLEEQGRVSLSALRLEFELDDERLESLIDELVDVQQVASREGKVLAWIGSARAMPTAEVSAPAAEAERRQLTVMFCDLVGSTKLSQLLDAEELRNVVRAFQEAASSVVEQYDGHIAQYLGDGVLVYFGYPQAHEDDAERAVRAGREILAALDRLNDSIEPQHGIRLTARVGIHSGAVVIGEMGGGAKSEVLALGDTANIAARLISVADPDSVMITAATLRLVAGLFVTNDLGTPEFKGIAEPIRVYSVLGATGVRSRLDLDSGELIPLVGREQELGLLQERWEQSGDGEGQTVLISGEAGLGKSRLLRSFREQLVETSHGWLECRCSPYTQRSAFHPVVELVERGLGFLPEHDSETKLERLEAGVAATGLSAAEVVPLIAPLLSLPLPDRYPPLAFSPELQRAKTIDALVAWILGLSETQSLVMLVEDLHWCDASTLELLGRLIEQSPTYKVLTLLSFRPDFEPHWPQRSHLTYLEVPHLSHRMAAHLIDGVTGDVPLPDAVVKRIVEQADGIPLFVEELTKMVLESDAVEKKEGRYELKGTLAEFEIPATLQGSLMARLDRLHEGKPVAQLGAALGREFLYELLEAVSPLESLQEGLDQLLDAELIYERGVRPDATYTFKHAMIQDAAYQSLLRRVRQQFHARIAEVLEERFPDRVAAQPEVIARHCAEGGLTEQAIGHYQRAGQMATQRSANEEASGHLGRALELLRKLPESSQRDQQELGLQLGLAVPLSAARGWSDSESEHAFERARELASQLGDAPELPRVLTGLAVAYHIAGDLESSAELAEEALDAAQRLGDDFDLLSALYAVGCPLYWRGEISQALQHFERAVELYDPDEHATRAFTIGIDRGVVCRNYAASSYWLGGRPDSALEIARDAVVLAKQVAHPLSEATAMVWEGWIHQLRRAQAQTIACANAGISLSEELGFPLFEGLGRTLRGWALATSNQGEAKAAEGIAEIQGALVSLAKSGTGIGAPQLLGSLAEACWKAGRHADALQALDLGDTRANDQGQHYYDAELYRLRAEIVLEADANDVEAARALLHSALEIARSQEARSLELRSAMSLGRLLRSQGERAEARALVEPVYAWFTEGFDTQDLKDAKAFLDASE
jgi:class 3 adenylate cyclase/predicted ATPase